MAETTAGAGAGAKVATCGSVLMLDVGQHLNLVEDYYAPGSIGQFSLQFTVLTDVKNDIAWFVDTKQLLN